LSKAGVVVIEKEAQMSFVTTAGGVGGRSGQLSSYRLFDERPKCRCSGANDEVVPAAANEVAALAAAHFAVHAQKYQAVSAQAAEIHEMFVNTLSFSAGSYATAETTSTVATR
jgi:hypothetical protein